MSDLSQNVFFFLHRNNKFRNLHESAVRIRFRVQTSLPNFGTLLQRNVPNRLRNTQSSVDANETKKKKKKKMKKKRTNEYVAFPFVASVTAVVFV